MATVKMCAIKILVNLAKFLKKSFSAEDIWSIAPIHYQERRFPDIYQNILLMKKKV